jgi:predicted TIM-barrel fold metal-dependent hydrolase
LINIILDVIIDFHTHIFPPDFSRRLGDLRRRDKTVKALFRDDNVRVATAQELLKRMDLDGVDRAVVMGLGWSDQALAREMNDYLLESAALYPDRLIPFCSVNPAWGEAALREVERCTLGGAKGIGEIHPDSQEFNLGVPQLVRPLVNLAQQLGLIMMVHSSEPVGHDYPGKGQTTPNLLYRFIRAFPEARIVCAHWGGGLPFYGLMPEVSDALANVYFDTAASPLLYHPDVFTAVHNIVGPERILMGSDYPLVSPGRLIRQVLECPLPQEAKIKMLGTNAATLLEVPYN